MTNRNKKLTVLIYTALAAAMVALSTMAIKIPSLKGYINFGDIMIFTAAALLGKRTGFIAGALGSALADILLSYPVYAPGTFIIKGLEGLICGLIIRKNESGTINILSLVIGVIVGAAWMVSGYFIYEYFLFGIGTAFSSIPGNAIQGGVSAVAAIPIILAIKKTKVDFEIED
jgi:uncharacterized membrane protein